MSEFARDLFGDGAPIASGHVGIEREKAREKLKKFRLPDPHFYVLQFVRAASVLGATRIDFQVSTTRMECHFDATLPPEVLENLWGVAFENREARGWRAAHHLALGLGSAQALEPSSIVVDSGGGRLVISDDDDRFEKLEDPTHGTSIRLKEKFRFGHLLEAFTDLSSGPPELAVLASLCALTRMEIRANSESTLPELLPAGRIDSGHPRLQHQTLDPMRWLVGKRTHERSLAGTELDDGFVALAEGWEQTCFALVSDDVLIGEEVFEIHGGLAGTGVVHSQRLQTDISGLKVVRDDAHRDLVYRAAFGTYHRALHEWALQAGELGEQLQLMTDVLGHVHEVRRLGLEPHQGTDQLIEWLASLPLFVTALGEESAELTPREVVRDGQIHYLTGRERSVRASSERPVVLYDASGRMPNRASERKLVREALDSWARHVGARMRDARDEIDERKRRARRREIWESQPPRTPPSFDFQRTVTEGDLSATVYVPIRDVTEHLIEDRARAALFVDGRLLRLELLDLPIGLELDGDFTPNAEFTGIEVDDSVVRLAARALDAANEVIREYADELVSAGRDAPDRPRPTDVWLLALARQEIARRVLFPLGFETTEIGRVLDATRTPPARLTDSLGPLAGIDSYVTVTDDRTTLCELLAAEQPTPFAADSPADRRFVQRALRELNASGRLRGTLLLSNAQLELLRLLGAPLVEARELIAKRRDDEAFFARPLWRDELSEDEIIETATEEDAAGSVRVDLLTALGEPSVLLVIHHGRLLFERETQLDAASFRTVINSRSVTPAAGYNGVEFDATFRQLADTAKKVRTELLDEWFRRVCLRDEWLELEGAERRLFLQLAAFRCRDREQAETRLVPVLESYSTGRGRRLATPREFRQQVRRDGGVICFTRTDEIDLDRLPHERSMVVILGDQDPELARDFYPHGELVDISRNASEYEESGRSSFDREEVGLTHDGAQLRLESTFEGSEVEVGRFETHGLTTPENADDGAERPDDADDDRWIMTAVTGQLLAARGDRTDLLDDHLAIDLRWVGDTASPAICLVDDGGVALRPDSELIRAVIESRGSSGAVRFLTSVVYSAINEHYRGITDTDELEFQRRLLRSARP